MHRPDYICLDTLRRYGTRCIRMANALTLRVQKADAVAHVVRTTFALTLSVRKKFALTISVCKECTASRWQMP